MAAACATTTACSYAARRDGGTTGSTVAAHCESVRSRRLSAGTTVAAGRGVSVACRLSVPTGPAKTAGLSASTGTAGAAECATGAALADRGATGATGATDTVERFAAGAAVPAHGRS